jgi:hypothetical protein
MSEVMEELLEVDEEKLKYRVEYIKENLLQMSQKLRDQIPQGLTDQGFNRMLYYLYDKSRGNIARLVNNYDVNIKFNSAGQLEDMNLVIMETETYEGDDE